MLKKNFGMKVLLFLFVSALCPAQEVQEAQGVQEVQEAQEANGGFWKGVGRVASFGKPFWADMHSTIIRGEISYATNSPDYDWGEINSKYRPYVFVNLGADIPIWSDNFAGEKYGLSITLPFLIDVWYDRFERITSPIINVAYRVGAFDACFIYRLDTPLAVFPQREESSLPGFLHFGIYNWALKFSFMKHESTHIGDELTVFRKDKNLPIARIDVAYNYAELVFIVNDPDGQTRRNHGFKTGILLNYKLKKGWYDIGNSEAQADLLERSRIPVEFFIQYQYQSALFSRGFQIITSFEYRLRERYRYPFFHSDAMDDFPQYNDTHDLNPAHCFNVFAGIRYDNQKRNYFSKTGIGLRYYYGINPYGQFRSMPCYHQWGLAVIFE